MARLWDGAPGGEPDHRSGVVQRGGEGCRAVLVPPFEGRKQALKRHRPAEEVPLTGWAALLPEPAALVLALHPLGDDQHAQAAAQAAEVAGLQGRFWQMHDVLYREQALWSKAPDVRSLFKAYAGTIGVNVAQFQNDLDSEEVKKRIAADQQQAAVVGVTTTPSIFINDRLVAVPQLNPPGLRAAIDAALREKARP